MVSLKLINFVALLVTLSKAIPLDVPLPCHPNSGYTVTSKKQISGAAFVGGTSVPSGGTLTYTSTHDVSTTVTVGLSLGVDIEKIFHLGVDSSVSVTTGNARSEGASDICTGGGSWTCALSITNSFYTVSGEKTGYGGGVGCGAPPSGPYTVQYPIIDKDGNAVVNAAACACPDYPSWAEAGAPPKCPGNCKTA